MAAEMSTKHDKPQCDVDLYEHRRSKQEHLGPLLDQADELVCQILGDLIDMHIGNYVDIRRHEAQLASLEETEEEWARVRARIKARIRYNNGSS